MTKLKIPQTWSDLKVYQFLELIELEDFRNEYDGYDYLFEQLSILCELDIDDDIFYELKDSEIYEIQDKIKWVSSTLPNSVVDTFTFDGYDYKLIEFDKLTVSEWITIDHYLKTNFKENAHKLIASIYRRYQLDKFGNYKLEAFTFEFENRAKSFLQLNLDKLPLQKLIDFRTNVYKTFLLNKKQIDDEVEEEMDLNKLNYREKANIRQKIEQEKIQQSFNWEKICMDVTNNDVVQAYNLLNTPVLWLFSIISMKNTLE